MLDGSPTGFSPDSDRAELPAAATEESGEVASELSKALGRPISHTSLTPSDLKECMLSQGMPKEIADRMLDLERYFCEGKASLLSNDIEAVTENKPRRFAQYARDYAKSLQSA